MFLTKAGVAVWTPASYRGPEFGSVYEQMRRAGVVIIYIANSY